MAETDRKNAFSGVGMDIALQIVDRAPSLQGPAREQVLLLLGISREVSHRNVVINSLVQELMTLTSYAHTEHKAKGAPISVYDCGTETCRRAVGIIKEAGAVATTSTAIEVGK